MPTTVEFPDEPLPEVKSEPSCQPEERKVRRDPPMIRSTDPNAPRIKAPTREQIDEAMFG